MESKNRDIACLLKYQGIFNAEESQTFKDVTENDYSKMVLNSGLINSDLIDMPRWFKQDIKIIPNDKIIINIKKIGNEILQRKVKKKCFYVMSKNDNNNDYKNLSEIIEKNLVEEFPNSNWLVNIANEKINNLDNINQIQLMIFQYSDQSKKVYIHVAKLK